MGGGREERKREEGRIGWLTYSSLGMSFEMGRIPLSLPRTFSCLPGSIDPSIIPEASPDLSFPSPSPDEHTTPACYSALLRTKSSPIAEECLCCSAEFQNLKGSCQWGEGWSGVCTNIKATWVTTAKLSQWHKQQIYRRLDREWGVKTIQI